MALLLLIKAQSAHAFVPPARWILEQVVNRARQENLKSFRVVWNSQTATEEWLFQAPNSMRLNRTDANGNRSIVRVKGQAWLLRSSQPPKRITNRPDILLELFTCAREKPSRAAASCWLNRLRDRRINITKASLDRTPDGRIAWLIGGMPRETHRARLWIDKEQAIPLRVTRIDNKRGKQKVFDSRYSAWRTHEPDGLLFPQVLRRHRDGNLIKRMTLQHVAKNPALSPRLFQPPSP